jgi:chromosome segregation ATPase
MTLVSEVTDGIHMLAKLIKDTREIIAAINDSRKFLASRHPEAQQEFSDLIEQMQRTIKGLAEVTTVISHFRFTCAETVDRQTADSELVRFNKYVIKQQAKISKLRGNISNLKGTCDKVAELRDKLDAQTETRSWGSLFGLLGDKAKQRTAELHDSLSSFYADDHG